MTNVIVTIICDDIRQELGHKISLMGIYDDMIKLPTFPYVFQKLGFVQKWKNLSGLSKFRLEVKSEGSSPLLVDGDISTPEKIDRPVNQMVGQFLINLTNLKIDRPGALTFTTYFNGSNQAANVHKVEVVKAMPEDLKISFD